MNFSQIKLTDKEIPRYLLCVILKDKEILNYFVVRLSGENMFSTSIDLFIAYKK